MIFDVNALVYVVKGMLELTITVPNYSYVSDNFL